MVIQIQLYITKKVLLLASFLRYDSKFSDVMHHVVFFIIVNVLWLLCCLPVVTAGAATTSLFYCMRKYRREKDPACWRVFFRAFSENWKQATAVWIVLLVLGVVISLSFYSMTVLELPHEWFFKFGVAFLTILWMIEALYFFPMLAHFYNRTAEMVINALLIGISHIFQTFMLVAVLGIAVLLCAGFPYFIPFWSFGGFALVAYVMEMIYEAVFSRYIEAKPACSPRKPGCTDDEPATPEALNGSMVHLGVIENRLAHKKSREKGEMR